MAGFQSFAERYIIERAREFKAGKEQEGAWLALQDARKIYGMIEQETHIEDQNATRIGREKLLEQLAASAADGVTAASPWPLPYPKYPGLQSQPQPTTQPTTRRKK